MLRHRAAGYRGSRVLPPGLLLVPALHPPSSSPVIRSDSEAAVVLRRLQRRPLPLHSRLPTPLALVAAHLQHLRVGALGPPYLRHRRNLAVAAAAVASAMVAVLSEVLVEA